MLQDLGFQNICVKTCDHFHIFESYQDFWDWMIAWIFHFTGCNKKMSTQFLQDCYKELSRKKEIKIVAKVLYVEAENLIS